MRFLADENVDRAVVHWLRARGHDVRWAIEDGPGAADSHWIAVAADERRVMLTFDLDFGEQVVRRANAPPGVVLVRLKHATAERIIDRLEAVWDTVTARGDRHLIVISERSVRIRPLRP